MGGVGEVRPEHQPRRGWRGATPGQPRRGAAGRAEAAALRSRPEVGGLLAGEGERPESARTKLPPPPRQQAGCAQLLGEKPPAAAHHPVPLPRPPDAPGAQHRLTPNHGASRGSRYLQRSRRPGDKVPVPSPPPPRPGSSLTKKLPVAGRPGGPARFARPDSPERLSRLHLQNLDLSGSQRQRRRLLCFLPSKQHHLPPFFLAERVPASHLPPPLTD